MFDSVNALKEGASYENCCVISAVDITFVFSTVTVTEFCPIPEDLPVLHEIDVAEFHLDCSHPVFPSRTDGVFPSPKFDPNTNSRTDPVDTVSHGRQQHTPRQAENNSKLQQQGWG
jgi:hypothetical protein